MNESVEDYLRSMYSLYEQLNDKSKGIKASDLAVELGVTRSSVSAMAKRLVDLGYLHARAYSRLFFTHKGIIEAKRIMHNHRIIEVFLRRILKRSVNKVHDEANRLEHAFSEESIRKLEKLLKYPEISPEGMNIPSKLGKVRIWLTLDLLDVGQSGKLVSIKTSSRLEKRLLAMGLVKGSKVTLERIAPLGDPIAIKVKGYSLSIRKKEARKIVIEIS